MSFKVAMDHANAIVGVHSEKRFANPSTPISECMRDALQEFVDENDLRPGLTPPQISAAVAAYNEAYAGGVGPSPSRASEFFRSQAREAGVKAFLKAEAESLAIVRPASSREKIREPKIVGISPAPSGWIYFRRVGNQTLGIDVSKITVFEIDAEGCFNVETNEGGVYEVAEADRDIVLSHLMAALNVKDLTGGAE